MTRRGLLALAGVPLRAADALREVRLLSVAPSPYTNRRDSFRAGCGILLCLRRLIAEHRLPLRATYFDAARLLDQPDKLRPLVQGAPVLLIGSSTWAQGPSPLIRRFFEIVDTTPIAGVQASAWVTSGGAHTGGEQVIETTYRTLLGMGASLFSAGQKAMVFTTDERLGVKAGEFLPLDCWFMEHFARAAIVAGLTAGNPAEAAALWTRLGAGPLYWNHIPKTESDIPTHLHQLRAKLNAAADPRSAARKELDGLLSPA